MKPYKSFSILMFVHFNSPEITSNNVHIISAVHRSRRAGAGVLTYFAGAGAGVCSPPAALICAANFYHRSTKKLTPSKKK